MAITVHGEERAISVLRFLRTQPEHLVKVFRDNHKRLTVPLAQTLCPYDTGALRSTIRQVDTPQGSRVMAGGQSKVNTRRGDRNVDYALYVHERLDVHHPIGQAKFLEEAVKMTDQPIRKAAKKAMRIKGGLTSRQKRSIYGAGWGRLPGARA